MQRHLSTAQEAIQAHQRTIEQLTHQITSLQEQIAAFSAKTKATEEGEKEVVPPEVQVHIETLRRQLRTLKEERDALAHRVTQLGEEATASLLLSMGVHPKIVQELLGHSTVSMTLDTYLHVLPLF